MNLFVLGWSLSASQQRQTSLALAETARAFPPLDPTTFSHYCAGHLYAGYVTTAKDAAAPRVYAHRRNGTLTLFDGNPVNMRRTFAAHDAAQLSRHWDELHDALEGHYVVARLDSDDGTLEVITDPLGIQQVFYLKQGRAVWISNSVHLLSLASQQWQIDEFGAALFLAMGFVGWNRTLRQGVQVLPGGERWSWHEGESSPRKRRYFSLPEHRPSRGASAGERIVKLANDMGAMLTELERHFGPLECPITGGRDSRMLTGLMLHYGVEGRFFTRGDKDDSDVQVGSAVARHFGLDHEVKSADQLDLVELWGEASHRLVVQNDGMVTLAHARNALEAPHHLEKLQMQLYGGAGEITRSAFVNEATLLSSRSIAGARKVLLTHYLPRNPYLQPVVAGQVNQYIHTATVDLLDRGFAPADVPDAFSVIEEQHRWTGAQFRQVRSRKEIFSPFVTRSYARAAFEVSAVERFMQVVPYRLLQHLSPELHRLPFAKEPWPPQTVAGLAFGHYPRWATSLAGKKLRERLPRGTTRSRKLSGRARVRAEVLETKLPELRMMCLDQTESPLWELVSRDGLERVLSDETAASTRSRHSGDLYKILTVFHYALLGPRQASPQSLPPMHDLFMPDASDELASR